MIRKQEGDVHYDDGKPVYNHKPIDDDSIEPNKECSQCDVEYTCFDCEIDQIRTRYPDARYVDSDEWVVPVKRVNPTEKKRRNYLAHFEKGVSDAFFLKKMDETKRSSAYYRRGYEFGLKLRLKKGRKPHER